MKKQILTLFSAFIATTAFSQTIPNGGFENWTSYQYEEPVGFSSSNSQNDNGHINIGNMAKTTDAYHGNYAVKLNTVLTGSDTSFAYVAIGDPGQNPPQGGLPYAQKPTGIRFHYKSNIIGTDSAIIFVMFKKNGSTIGNFLYKIGASKTVYTLFSKTFSPVLPVVPDSMVFGAASSNAFAGSGTPGNMLQIDSVTFTGVTQQPIGFNGDFEFWQTKTDNQLNGWVTESTANQLNTVGNVYTGAFALELQTNLQSFGGGVRSAFATTGIPTHYSTIGGHPYTQTIDTLFFYYKYLAADINDQASVGINFKLNGNQVGGVQIPITNTGNSYVLGKIPFNIGATPPDSAIIFIKSSNMSPTPSSYIGSDLKIDNMYLGSQRLPVSKFTLPALGCVGVPLQFSDVSDNMVTSWQWITGGGNPTSSNNENLFVTYNSVGTHTITMQAGNSFGSAAPISHTITIYANPVVSATGTMVCQGNQATLSASAPGAISYTWSTGSNMATTSVTPTTTTNYTVTASNAYGCIGSDMATVNVLTAPVPNICLVSCDDSSKYNIIYWDKTPYNNVDSFIAYRETSSNNYKRIGSQAYSALSQLIDTARSVGGPNGGNPNSGTYRYKLQTVDTCGNYSLLSPFHNTIFITTNGTGQFSWTTSYMIEGQPSPDTNYVLACDTANTNVWKTVASVSGSQQTLADPGFINHATIANWRVDGLGFNCTPTMLLAGGGNNSTMAAKIKSHSNQANNRSSGIKKHATDAIDVNLYPNPGNGLITISTSQKMDELKVTDMLGNTIYDIKPANQKINLQLENSGVYFITILSGNQSIIKKVVVAN
ncbi:MAG: PKD domain-containing protein [Bacteroidia bacterium]